MDGTSGTMILTAIKTLSLWILLCLIGVNLMSMVIIGVVGPIPRVDAKMDPIVRNEYRKQQLSIVAWAAISLLLLACYLVLVHWAWGNLMLLAAVMLTLVRVPEQISEALTGERASTRVNIFDLVTMPLWFGAIPVIWLALS